MKKGDKVRLTHKPHQVLGVVLNPKDTDGYTILLDGRHVYLNDYDVEIVERADDPSKDLPGTVRENTGAYGGVYVKVYDGFVHVVGGFHPLAGTETVGAKVGTVPGSPAAKAEKDVTPLVVHYGAPEPPRDKKFKDCMGDVWRFGADFQGKIGWHFSNGTASRPWIRVSAFPLTEVFE